MDRPVGPQCGRVVAASRLDVVAPVDHDGLDPVADLSRHAEVPAAIRESAKKQAAIAAELRRGAKQARERAAVLRAQAAELRNRAGEQLDAAADERDTDADADADADQRGLAPPDQG